MTRCWYNSVKFIHIIFIGLMITNVQIFTTQLTVSFSTRSRLSLFFYSLLLWTQLQNG